MWLKKVLFLILSFLLVAAGTLYAAEGNRHLSKKNAFSVKIGTQFYNESDFTDRWEIDEQDLAGFAWELAYERKTQSVGIEFSFGHNVSSAESDNILAANDSFEVKIDNLYLSPTVKFYLPLNNSFVFYGGIGPDLYYTSTDYEYTGASAISKDDHFFTLGAHGLAGVEYYFLKDPAKHRVDEPPLHDAPVSLLLEYRYSWVEIEDADETLIANLDSDLDVGGHMIFVGLRWHY
jgi:opacity protein-like surface antigen